MAEQTPVFGVEMFLGRKLPRERYSNQRLIDDFGIDSTPEWVYDHTGINYRYLCSEDENVVTLGAGGALSAIRKAGLSKRQPIDYMYVASSTADTYRPISGAHPGIHAILREKGYKVTAAHDLNLACTGLMKALEEAYKLFLTDGIDTALVVATENLSKKIGFFDEVPQSIRNLKAAYEASRGTAIDPDLAMYIEALLEEQGEKEAVDRGTAIIFGDAGTGTVLKRVPGSESGLHGWAHETDSSEEEILYENAGERIYMEGPKVLKQARTVMVKIGNMALDQAEANTEITRDQIDWVVPHQANIRIIDYANEKLGFRPEQLIVDLDRHGNTSTASVPLAIMRGIRQGKIKRGHNILMPGFGGGMGYEAIVVTY